MCPLAAVGQAGLVAVWFRGHLAAPGGCSGAVSCSLSVLEGRRSCCPRQFCWPSSPRPLALLVPQVLLEALYFSLVAKRLHPEEDDTLVEHPFVEHVSEKISKVRPPQGFALFQAKEEARKVKLLHRMLKVRPVLGQSAGSGS